MLDVVYCRFHSVFLQICMEHQHEKLYIKFSVLIHKYCVKNQALVHPSFCHLLVRAVWRRVEAAMQRVKSERKEDSENGAASEKISFPRMLTKQLQSGRTRKDLCRRR